MNTTSNKGYFSIDLIIAYSIVLVGIVFLTTYFFQNYEYLKPDNELTQKTIFFADSLIKNRNPGDPIKGSAEIDYEKKRVMTNILSKELLNKINSYQIDNFFIKEISLDKKIIFKENLMSEECKTIKRYVIVENLKKVLEVKGCLK
jgi:hypothetical protein